MKHRLVIVAIFLLAGAVVNVAVAWGVFYLSLPSYSTDLEETEAADLLTGHTDISVVNAEGFEERRIGVWGVVALQVRGNLVEALVSLTESGWPVKTMQGRLLHVNGKTDLHWLTSHRFIPLRPLWPGFAINTILYATTLWLLICGPFALRRHLRIRRGLCPACGYDLRHGEHDACPECGRLAAAR